MVRRDTFLPSSSQSVLLFSLSACLLKYVEEEVLSLLLPLPGPPCSFLSDALFLLLLFCCAACVGSPPSLHLPSLCWSLALWPAEWFAPQLPAVTICPFNVWSADAHSPPSFPISPSLPLSLSLAVFLLALIISFSPSFSFFSHAKGDKLHLLVSMRSHWEKRLWQQVIFFKQTRVTWILVLVQSE